MKQIAGSIITQIFESPWDSPASKTNQLTIKKFVIMGLWKRKFHSVSVLDDPNLKILSYSSIGLLDLGCQMISKIVTFKKINSKKSLQKILLNF